MQTIKLLSGPDGAHVYKFVTTDEYKSLRLYFKEFQNGKIVNRDDEYWEIGFDGIGSPKEGEILIIPDFENFMIKIIISTEESTLSAEVPILMKVEEREYYGRSASRIESKTEIAYGIEQPLVGLIYDNDVVSVPGIYDIIDGETDLISQNDYMYFFSYEFCKE